MPRRPVRTDPARPDDRGAALLTVVLFVFVVSLLGAVTSIAGLSALTNSRRDLAGATAAATSNAGIAEGLAYIRSHGLGALTCAEPASPASDPAWTSAAGCTAPGWTDPLAPTTVSGGSAGPCVPGQDCYQVWIGLLQPYQPPAGAQDVSGAARAVPAIARIHSTGVAGAGPGRRAVVADVSITPSRFPLGIYGTTFAMHSAHSPFTNESLFTAGDILLKCAPTGLDPEYDIPAAVHAAGTITYQSEACSGGPAPSSDEAGDGHCSLNDPYDQASTGGSLAGTGCYNYDQQDPSVGSANPPVAAYPQTSHFDANALAAYGYRPEGLSPQEYSQLRTTAAAEGTYNVVGSALTAALNALVSQGVTDPVVFEDNGTSPALGDFPAQFFRSPGTCPTPSYALTVVVKNADLHWSGNYGSLAASVFVPDNTFDATGQASVVGTLFAQNISFEGQGNFQLDRCFVQNPPAGVLTVTVLNYRTADTGSLTG